MIEAIYRFTGFNSFSNIRGKILYYPPVGYETRLEERARNLNAVVTSDWFWGVKPDRSEYVMTRSCFEILDK